jgi:hypothetical protein
MNIVQLKNIVELLQKANNLKYALLAEVAKELKVSKTDLMKFIEDEPGRVYCENVWSYKEKKVKRRLWPNDPNSVYIDTEMVKNRSLGLGIVSVYLLERDNYRTNAWLRHKIETCDKTLQITEWDNYGYIEGYYVSIDSKDTKLREGYWRNTSEKLQWLKDNNFLYSTTFSTGGFGDCSIHKIDSAISPESIQKLKVLGWQINELKPLAQYSSK